MRLGVDLGGTKTEIIALDAARSANGLRRRIATPQRLCRHCCARFRSGGRGRKPSWASAARVGIAIPGTVSRRHRPDQERQFHLAERQAVARAIWRRRWDGQCGWPMTPIVLRCRKPPTARRAGAAWCSASLLGTGCGGGVVVDGKVLEGAHGIGGEWGHNPLPAHDASRNGRDAPPAIAASAAASSNWLQRARPSPRISSGTRRRTCDWTAEQIAASDTPEAKRRDGALDGPAGAAPWPSVVNILDPDVIVLGGGLSNIEQPLSRAAAAGGTSRLHAGSAAAHRQEYAWQFQRRARRRLAVAGLMAQDRRLGRR